MQPRTSRKHARRRRSSSVGPDFARRLKQLRARIPEGLLASLSLGLLLAVGLTMMWLGRPNNEIPGVGVCTLAVSGLLWQAWQWRQRQLEAQRRREKVQVRLRRRRERRLRDAEDQNRRERRAATDTAAHERAREFEDARRQSETEQAAEQEKRRQAREEAIAHDAARLIEMDEESLLVAAIDAFHSRGFVASPVGDESDCDLLLEDEKGRISAVARQVPHARRADITDIEALEAWRRDAGAATAYLIGVAGFTPAVIRLAASLPIMLVEPYLLAQWRSEEATGRYG